MMTGTNTFYSQYHEGRIGGDIIGNLTRGCVIDRLSRMRHQERTVYNCRITTTSTSSSSSATKASAAGAAVGVVTPSPPTPPPSFPPSSSSGASTSNSVVGGAIVGDSSLSQLNSSWREKICHWSFNVVDHFDLSREVVAVSMSLFDRYLATRNNKCNGSTALLASLTTLHIAIKVHEVRKIKLTTLANLSRGQFGPKHIEEMEWKILNSLNWHIHPPTSMSFLSHLLLLLPPQVTDSSKEDIYALSRYITELSVCDSSFVEIYPSAVAFSAILNSLEDRRYRRLIPTGVREQFLRAIATHVELRHDDEHVLLARPKLKRLLTSSLGQDTLPHDQLQQQQNQQQQGVASSSSSSAQQHPQQQGVTTVDSVTSSVNGMQIQDSKGAAGDDSSLSSRQSRHSQTSSFDSILSGQQRRTTTTTTASTSGGVGGSLGRPVVAIASPRTGGRARVAPSPCITVMSTSPCSLSSARSGRSVFSRSARSPLTSLLPA
jgi:hypothetical protein